MDERQVKAAVLTMVRAANKQKRKPITTAEFSLGSSGVRADLAIFADENIGIEIKAARDSLKRLPNQMHAYSKYFHRSIAIVASNHLSKLDEKSLFGASLWTFDANGHFRILIAGIRHNVGDDALLDLMTRMERQKGTFNDAVKARYQSTSQSFWSAVARTSIKPEHLQLLSRFAESRLQARSLAAEREIWWGEWSAAQNHAAAISP